jgi:hypothetical protein
MNNQPEWISSWIRFVPEMASMMFEISVEPSDAVIRTAKLTATWQGDDCEAKECLLDMPLADDSIRLMWKPHLTPDEDMVIGDLLFRSPAIVLRKDEKQFALFPDIDRLESDHSEPHIMDCVMTDRRMYYGLCRYEKTGHVYHRKNGQPLRIRKRQTLFSFYLVEWSQVEEDRRYVGVSDWIWHRFAKRRMTLNGDNDDGDSTAYLGKLFPYVDHAYDWAFRRWEEIVWQQFELDGKTVGGAVFIVRAEQAPGFGQEKVWREKKSLWNQAWFCSLRSAYGYRLWGERRNDSDLIRRADLSRAFALSAPQNEGLFPSVFVAGENQEWESGAWGFSDRRPPGHENFAHLLDMSWTCYWMTRWYEDIEPDERLADYSETYGKRLITLQNEDGSFPAWVHTETGDKSPYLVDSGETALHVWFLLRLNRIRPNPDYVMSAEAGIEFLQIEILPERRWEDFETYWSCARSWEKKNCGVKDARSGLFNQSTFSMYWTAEAFREWYEYSRDHRYLRLGEDVLAELSLYQSIWEPPYLGGIPVLGGYGVLNSDDEWNDARQSLIALTHMAYYRLTGNKQHLYRSIWAMRASFYMMYCPENPEVKALYEQKYPHFGHRDYGFEMENFHHGETHGEVGEFTIFDWGNGSAAASLAELLLTSKSE